jgi:hypothetical protein
VAPPGHLKRLAATIGARPLFEYPLVLAASSLCVLAIGLRVDLKTVGTAAFADPGWDRHLYREMASRGLFHFHIAPYCWRVLVPALAKLLPASHQAGFATVTFVSLAAIGPALYWLVRGAEASRAVAVAVALLYYSLGWGPRFVACDFWVPDAAAMLLTVLAMGAIVRRQWLTAAAVLAVGVLAKESVLFVAPLAYTWHARRLIDWPLARTTLFVAAPALLLLVAVRLGIPAQNDDSAYLSSMPPEISRFPELYQSYTYPDRFHDIVVEDRWPHREWHDLDRYFLDPFGLPILVLGLAGAAVRPGRVSRLLPFVVLVYAQLLFAADTQRLLVLSFVAVALLAPPVLSYLSRTLRLSEWSWAAVAAALFVASLRDANHFSARNLEQTAVILVTVAVLAGAARADAALRPPPPPQSPSPR